MTELEALQALTYANLALSFCALVIAAKRTVLRPVKKRLGELQDELTILEERVGALADAWKRLNSRQAMREARAAKKSRPDGIPDPVEEPEAWRRYARSLAHNHRRLM